MYLSIYFVQSLCCVWLFAAPWTAACQTSPSLTISLSLLKLMCPLSQWCHPTISSSCLQSFPTLGSFPVKWLFASGGQRIGASTSASVLPVNIQGWYPLRLTALISLPSKGLKSLLQHHSSKSSILWCSAFFMVQFLHPHLTRGKTIALSVKCSQIFNTLSRFVIYFYATVNNVFFFFGVPHGLQDLTSLTSDWTRTTAGKALSLNYWTTKEFPMTLLKLNGLLKITFVYCLLLAFTYVTDLCISSKYLAKLLISHIFCILFCRK